MSVDQLFPRPGPFLQILLLDLRVTLRTTSYGSYNRNPVPAPTRRPREDTQDN